MALQSITEQVAALKATGLSIADIEAQAGTYMLGSDEAGWCVPGLKNLDKIDALVAARVAPAAPVATNTGRPAARRPRCTDHETDNRGNCYDCGAYVPADDVVRIMGRYGII